MDHTVSAFDDELRALGARLVDMGLMARRSVVDAVSALANRDGDLASQVSKDDDRIDALQKEIEEAGVLLIARRQPVARDLREVVAALRIAADLERIGDLAKNIAKRNVALTKIRQPQRLIGGVETLSTLVLDRLADVMAAFDARDAEAALRVWRGDGDIDVTYTAIFRSLLTYMMEDPRNITACTHLLFAAKNLERIGDHAANIAESVFYAATGNILTDDQDPPPEMVPAAAPVPVR
ncbi:phosphate signaling complex protein PhoU [Phreatobacter aquaticus]|uniref:Phosphate-specific transport system accessory protein PhoU n=1 Tax=Phreatobacter aquaticus TaxID=2570229 RepID=A0A4D7QDQ3_9HYPH|nr:phosphate signaling complex protein PhoU [Phreatobacter aquaticus]QCK86130.1 phosphate signaling complex protein PhoU [Phreatobacter aquaticus]